MIEAVKLSKRLKKVASYVPEGALFADIGTDHAYLPCYICLHDEKAKAIAGEVNEGPFNSAVETVHLYGLSDSIEVRLGNGLEIVENEEVNQLVIAGMGGALIRSILEEGISKLNAVNRIVVQPNIDARTIRKWFLVYGFTVTNEAILEENGHIYEIIVADRGENRSPYDASIVDQQLLFGPLLMKNRTATFYQKWKHEYEKLQSVIDQMDKAKVKDTQKINQFEKELKWMKEVLSDD